MHLYFHIPFCKQACYYCDFHFNTNLSLKDQLVAGIVKEIELQKDYLTSKKLQTIYFGGGTPSLLSKDNFQDIFQQITHFYDISEIQEITLEANPDDVNQQNIDIWKSFGINRISLGVQSFDEETLKAMNRAHTSREAENAIELLLKNNIQNISIDLIYARLNEDSNEKLAADLDKILVYNLPHISAYNLTIEEKTVLGKWQKQGKITKADEDFAANQFDFLVETLEKNGYEQYEISNFAKNQNYAIHNSAYWLNHQYLGIGPAAHSFDLINRQANIANNPKYIKSIEDGIVPFELEILTNAEKANDYLLAGLRTIWGVNLEELSKIISFTPEFNKTLEDFISKNWIENIDNYLKITKKGRIFSDKIASDLFF